MTLFTWLGSSAAGPWSGISLLNLVPASIKYDPIVNFHLLLLHVTFFFNWDWLKFTLRKLIETGPCIRVSQQWLWSKNNQLWGGKKEDADWVTDKQQLYSVIHVFIRGLEKTPEIRAFISFHANLLSPYNTQRWCWRKHLLPKLNESNFFWAHQTRSRSSNPVKKKTKKQASRFIPHWHRH